LVTFPLIGDSRANLGASRFMVEQVTHSELATNVLGALLVDMDKKAPSEKTQRDKDAELEAIALMSHFLRARRPESLASDSKEDKKAMVVSSEFSESASGVTADSSTNLQSSPLAESGKEQTQRMVAAKIAELELMKKS
jgi:hypothetical protein